MVRELEFLNHPQIPVLTPPRYLPTAWKEQNRYNLNGEADTSTVYEESELCPESSRPNFESRHHVRSYLLICWE